MKIPKYVQDIMSRSEYDFNFSLSCENCGAGYTIRVHKESEYTKIKTFYKELIRLHKWCKRSCPEPDCCIILQVPAETHYCDQTALITIWDPLMQYLEKFIPREEVK